MNGTLASGVRVLVSGHRLLCWRDIYSSAFNHIFFGRCMLWTRCKPLILWLIILMLQPPAVGLPIKMLVVAEWTLSACGTSAALAKEGLIAKCAR